jgi:pilus assembly protein Flp/PilA
VSGWSHSPALKLNGAGSRGLAAERSFIPMNWLNDRILRLKIWRDCKGQDLVEYALAAGMVAVAAVAAMPALSGTVNNVFTKIGSIITANVH